MPETVPVSPKILAWARQRAGYGPDAMAKRFPKYPRWESGEAAPTMRQLDMVAKATAVPLGYFFLNDPPEEKLPITDFRTIRDNGVFSPSPDLLATIHAMQQRQEWFREYSLMEGESPLHFVGSATKQANVETLAARMRQELGLADGWASAVSTWEEAIRLLRRKIDDTGILVVISGIVGNDTHRKLNVDEFRGFVLIDNYAPLIFINGADAKAAQMFTLAHELCHVWLGEGGLFNLPKLTSSDHGVEKFCNQVAAEFLVPAASFRKEWDKASSSESQPFVQLARVFKVSPLVIGRRALDLELVSREDFFNYYSAYLELEQQKSKKKDGGGDFYRTLEARVGRRFGNVVVRSAREGHLLYRDAYRLLGVKASAFEKFASRMGYEK